MAIILNGKFSLWRDGTKLLYLTATVVAILLFRAFVWRRSPTSPKAPAAVREDWPLIGAWKFWPQRWTFFQESIRGSMSGNFSFFVGKHPVVGLSGDESRQIFYHSKQLGLAEGYTILMGKLPSTHVEGEQGEDMWPKQEFLNYMKERVKRFVNRDALAHRLPTLIADTQARLDELPVITDPFDSLYRLIYLLIMRAVGCVELSGNRELLDKTLNYYNKISGSASPTVILFPWLPSFNLVRRFYYGARLYFVLNGIVEKRQKLYEVGQRDFDDPLQELVNRRCGTGHIIGVLLGAVFAGQQNTAVNAAWIMVHLAHNKEWASRVRSEVEAVAKKYDASEEVALDEKLARLPLEAWETEFPTIDLCIKENLRIHGLGSQVRQNTSGRDLALGKCGEVIPDQTFATYHTADVHLDPSVYSEPLIWEPSRYLPDRAEHKKKPLAWVGWGIGRHPCLGMKLAELELRLLIGFFFAKFDHIDLCDKQGTARNTLPSIDWESWISDRPKESIYLKLQRKQA